MEKKMKRKRVRRGDEVIIIAGNDRGKSGKIIGFKGDNRVIVEGVNVRKKHMKRTQQNPKGQIIDLECPIHISNVMASVGGRGVKLRVRENPEGEKELYYRDSGEESSYRVANKERS
jgi:large subunit ribosomal protein L24